MSNKTISVVMSAYNEPERFLRESIESILNQTYRDFEFIIIQDNPENEAIERVVKEYEAKDSRVRCYKNEKNIGLALSLNRGIELARYEIIARMDADDIALPERFEREVAFLEAHPEVHLVSVNYANIDENGDIVGHERTNFPKDFKEMVKRMEQKNIVLHPGFMMYKKDLDQIGGYRNFPAEDYELLMRYVTQGWQFTIIKEILMHYRIRTQNFTFSKALNQWISEKYIKSLYKERLKSGKDSYSDENLAKMLEKAGCNDPKKREGFNKARRLMFEGKSDLIEHKYLTCLFKLTKAFFLHKEMPAYIVRTIKAFLADR